MAGEAPHCLVISDGRRGIENQALGLAEAIAALQPLSIQTKHISHGKAVAALPAKAQLRLAKFEFPECDLAIGCGRQAIAPLLYLKRNFPDVMTVYVQDPKMDTENFDLVVAPAHDQLEGREVEEMIGSPNRITREKIILDTLNYATGLSKLPAPRVAILIGGPSKTHSLDDETHQAHLDAAIALRDAGHSLLISASRRTPKSIVLDWRRFASDHDQIWLHDGEGPNPYFAFLGAADMILVTEESTNMLTEACATGKPVFRLPMSGRPGKFQILYEALERHCGAVGYTGQLGGVDYPPLAETQRVARCVLEVFNARLKG